MNDKSSVFKKKVIIDSDEDSEIKENEKFKRMLSSKSKDLKSDFGNLSELQINEDERYASKLSLIKKYNKSIYQKKVDSKNLAVLYEGEKVIISDTGSLVLNKTFYIEGIITISTVRVFFVPDNIEILEQKAINVNFLNVLYPFIIR